MCFSARPASHAHKNIGCSLLSCQPGPTARLAYPRHQPTRTSKVLSFEGGRSIFSLFRTISSWKLVSERPRPVISNSLPAATALFFSFAARFLKGIHGLIHRGRQGECRQSTRYYISIFSPFYLGHLYLYLSHSSYLSLCLQIIARVLRGPCMPRPMPYRFQLNTDLPTAENYCHQGYDETDLQLYRAACVAKKRYPAYTSNSSTDKRSLVCRRRGQTGVSPNLEPVLTRSIQDSGLVAGS